MNNDFSGQADNVVQAGQINGAVQHVGEGYAISGDFNGNVVAHFGNSPAPVQPLPAGPLTVGALRAFLAGLPDDYALTFSVNYSEWTGPLVRDHLVVLHDTRTLEVEL